MAEHDDAIARAKATEESARAYYEKLLQSKTKVHKLGSTIVLLFGQNQEMRKYHKLSYCTVEELRREYACLADQLKELQDIIPLMKEVRDRVIAHLREMLLRFALTLTIPSTVTPEEVMILFPLFRLVPLNSDIFKVALLSMHRLFCSLFSQLLLFCKCFL